MPRVVVTLPLCLALGLVAGCAANGDPPNGSKTLTEPAKSAATAGALGAPVSARDVAVLVLEQTPSSLRVTSSATRPRSSFGPTASWNGAGAATHRWTLIGAHGETIGAGDIVARGAVVEAPPNAAQNAPAAHVTQATFSFVAKVPQPAAGERIEIAAVSAGVTSGAGATALVARWP